MAITHEARTGLLAVVAAAVFAFAGERLALVKRVAPGGEIEVALPLFVQVALTGGDRFLAANLATIRALLVTTERMAADDYKVLGKVQTDAAWLNPAHEDNYYLAAAILPWAGQVDAAQYVLEKAALARVGDVSPAFYYAFNQLHFRHDPVGAAEWLRAAAERTPNEDDRLLLQDFAARWVDRSRDLKLAIVVVEAMIRDAKRKDFRAYLELRLRRLKQLAELREVAGVFREMRGRAPQHLDELVGPGLLKALPNDPFGFGYGLDKTGEVILFNAPKK